jgi:selenocysteine lyase/cysteine desulfurase
MSEGSCSPLESHFGRFRTGIVGLDQTFQSPYGEQRIVYADWTASGRLYRPIEQRMLEVFGPFVGNTHSESNTTGTAMTRAYHAAHEIIKRHVQAGPDDVIITQGSGMTAMVNKWQRILGLRLPEHFARYCHIPQPERPVVFLTHMEHHSNHTSWLETVCDVEVIEPDERGLVSLDSLCELLDRHRHRQHKIGAFSACSNVTGVSTPYHALARLMHEAGGVAFVDFAASAPYVAIDMHPPNALEKLDAIYFSPHKFLGGPGTPGVLVFDTALYHNRVPDQPGGGTVSWTNPWKGHRFLDDIEAREDGGTPSFLQTIKAALAVELKEQMGVEAILAREHELLPILLRKLRSIPGIHLLADHLEERLGIVSFHVEGVHYNLMVKLLNDRFGVQARGGCSCAGTYGHYLLHVDPNRSKAITDLIDSGDLSQKPGWVRLSIHPTTTNEEAAFITGAVRECVLNAGRWSRDYSYSSKTNEYRHVRARADADDVQRWFVLDAVPS